MADATFIHPGSFSFVSLSLLFLMRQKQLPQTEQRKRSLA